MKNIIFLFISVIFFTSCKKQGETYEVSGIVGGDISGIVVLIQDKQNRLDADTSIIKNGKFHIIGSMNLKYPEVYKIMIEKPDQRFFETYELLISPGDKIFVRLNTEDIKDSQSQGSNMNDEFQKYMNNIGNLDRKKLERLYIEGEKAFEENDSLRVNELLKEIESITNKKKQSAYNYIKSNPRSFVSAYSLYSNYLNELFTRDEVKELLNVLGENLKDSKYIVDIIDIDRNQPGKKATDFTLQDVNGKEVIFSEFCKDKVVLLEFWASWCRPCREMNPKLEELYNRYKDEGFEILGISLDRNPEILRESIRKDGITWTNLLDEKGSGSVDESYNLHSSSIPANTLVDKNGTVIAKNLNVEKLEEFVRELFSE